MVRKQSLADAKIDFKDMGFKKKKTFFELNNTELKMLQSLLDITKFSKPSGKSKLRGFYESLNK